MDGHNHRHVETAAEAGATLCHGRNYKGIEVL